MHPVVAVSGGQAPLNVTANAARMTSLMGTPISVPRPSSEAWQPAWSCVSADLLDHRDLQVIS